MQSAAAFSILAVTVGLSLRRPFVGSLQIQPPVAAIVGAALTLMLGLVSLPELAEILRLLRFPIITLISLMAMTLVAEQAGLFQMLATRVATLAKGDGHTLDAADRVTGRAVVVSPPTQPWCVHLVWALH